MKEGEITGLDDEAMKRGGGVRSDGKSRTYIDSSGSGDNRHEERKLVERCQ